MQYLLLTLLSLLLIISNSLADVLTHHSSDKSINFAVGRSLFKKLWIAAPSTTKASDGLGPLYNARSCFQCHINAGRGQVPKKDQPAISLFMRLSIPPQNKADKEALKQHKKTVIAEPNYGTQFQTFAVTGLDAEGDLHIRYSDVVINLSDNEVVVLKKPKYQLNHLQYGKLHPDTLLSPRLAPALVGMGLLAKIKAEDILQYSDPEDKNNDGISGKANQVWSREFKKVMLGRFGYKAGIATLDEQNQSAFAGDIGLSTPLFPRPWGDCMPTQANCINAPHGDDASQQHLEVPKIASDAVLYYVSHLTLAKPKPLTPPALIGQKYFIQAGCHACHRPSYKLDKEVISPYSDLLLHDMGEGLADHRPEGEANGQEWRTTPLWGIGHTDAINRHHYYLHDGRARTLQQAILWHGGEAKKARDFYIHLAKKDRQHLLEFLGTL